MRKPSSKQQNPTTPQEKTSLVARYCGETPVTKKSFNEQIMSRMTYSSNQDKKD